MANIAAVSVSHNELWKTASRLALVTREPVFPSLEVPAVNPLFTSGLTRGGIVEIYGLRSSGRTSVCLHVLAQATARGEVCAIVDLDGSFHPLSAAAAGVRLSQLLWVRCRGNAEHAMRAADLLLHAGGFGAVILDLSEASARVLNRIPLSYWHRFRRAVENTPVILIVCTPTPQVKSSARQGVQLKQKTFHWSGKAPFVVFRGIEFTAIPHDTRAFLPAPVTLRTVA